jgi:hypothetical protein
MENSSTWKEEVSTRLELDPPVTVSKFRSRLSGLTLVLADVDGPIIEACFCVSKFNMIREPFVVCSNPDPAKKNQKDLIFHMLSISGTQPTNDAGHPHAIEHLVFLGSKNFPQKVFFLSF